MYPTDGILVHANHFQAFVPEQIKDTYRPFSVDSLYRVPRIEAGLRKVKHAGSSEQVRETIAATLRDHFGYPNAVCNHPDERDHPFERTQTVASSIVDLSTGEYWAALGTPCEAEYQRLPWNIYDAAPSGLSTAAAAAAAATVASLSSGKDATGVGSRPDRAILAAG
jgi:isopenicillin-N N-acyltransferase-like protein